MQGALPIQVIVFRQFGYLTTKYLTNHTLKQVLHLIQNAILQQTYILSTCCRGRIYYEVLKKFVKSPFKASFVENLSENVGKVDIYASKLNLPSLTMLDLVEKGLVRVGRSGINHRDNIFLKYITSQFIFIIH